MFTHPLDPSILERAITMVAPANELPASALSCLDGEGLVGRFEVEFSHAVGVDFALAMPSGTAALHTALLAADIGPGDEVIVSTYGWGQTAGAVLLTGATPVFADILETTGNLDPAAAEALVSNATKAIVVTHMFGLPADMLELTKICRRRGIVLIADAAQALGALYLGRPMGAWGDIVCFSLGRGKAITTGEGGAVVTRDADLYERMVLVSQHPVRGLRSIEDPILRRSVTEFGESYRLSSLAAALGILQISKLKNRIDQRRTEVQRLEPHLRAAGVVLPVDEDGARHAYHTVVATPETGTEIARYDYMSALATQGIEATTGPVRQPLHLRFPFVRCERKWFPKSLLPTNRHESWAEGSCPIAERRCSEEEMLLTIPASCAEATPSVQSTTEGTKT